MTFGTLIAAFVVWCLCMSVLYALASLFEYLDSILKGTHDEHTHNQTPDRSATTQV